MTDQLDTILRRVAAGELTPEEAEAMLPPDPPHPMDAPRPMRHDQTPAKRVVRLQVTERGRSVVDLRIPMNLASLAGEAVPGLATAHMERIRDAIRAGEIGPVLEIRDEDGDGVIISTE